MRDKRFPTIPSLDQIEGARRTHCVHRREELGVEYSRFADDYHGVPRGTVLLGHRDDRIVPGYPRVGRILALERGVREHFAGEFYADEKIDGYNVRIVAAGDVLLPFTRNGVVCPFTADRLPDLLDVRVIRALFAEDPELVVCAEVAGPDNPYIDAPTPHASSDVSVFVFDFMRCGSEEFVPLGEREALLERYPLPRAPFVGRFTAADVPRLKTELLRLETEGGEGLVLKPPSSGPRLKYVVPGTAITALRADAALELELPGEYFTHKIARLAIGLRELGLRREEQRLAVAIGEALLQGFETALDEFERTGEVAKRFSFKVRDPATITRVIDAVNAGSRTVRLRELERHQEGAHTRVVVAKTFKRSTDILDNILSGRAVFD